MSTKKKILGLVAISIACATLGLALLSCDSHGQQREVEFGYRVVEIDGCEYLHKRVSKVNNIVLIHLSPGNSNASEFLKGIKELTGKTVYIADRGMEIEFNKTPF